MGGAARRCPHNGHRLQLCTLSEPHLLLPTAADDEAAPRAAMAPTFNTPNTHARDVVECLLTLSTARGLRISPPCVRAVSDWTDRADRMHGASHAPYGGERESWRVVFGSSV